MNPEDITAACVLERRNVSCRVPQRRQCRASWRRGGARVRSRVGYGVRSHYRSVRGLQCRSVPRTAGERVGQVSWGDYCETILVPKGGQGVGLKELHCVTIYDQCDRCWVRVDLGYFETDDASIVVSRARPLPLAGWTRGTDSGDLCPQCAAAPPSPPKRRTKRRKTGAEPSASRRPRAGTRTK